MGKSFLRLLGVLVFVWVFAGAHQAAAAEEKPPGIFRQLCIAILGRPLFHRTREDYDRYINDLEMYPSKKLVSLFLAAPYFDLRVRAIDAVSLLDPDHRLALIKKALKDVHPAVRMKAAQQLPSIEMTAESMPCLATALTDTEPNVRQMAVNYLKGRQDPHSLRAIGYALFSVTLRQFHPYELESENRWAFLTMKLDALQALEGRSPEERATVFAEARKLSPFPPYADSPWEKELARLEGI